MLDKGPGRRNRGVGSYLLHFRGMSARVPPLRGMNTEEGQHLETKCISVCCLLWRYMAYSWKGKPEGYSWLVRNSKTISVVSILTQRLITNHSFAGWFRWPRCTRTKDKVLQVRIHEIFVDYFLSFREGLLCRRHFVVCSAILFATFEWVKLEQVQNYICALWHKQRTCEYWGIHYKFLS